MVCVNVVSLLPAVVALFATGPPAPDDSWIGMEATRSRITLIGVDGSSPKVILDSPRRYAAPDWTPDGTSLIVNGGGKAVVQNNCSNMHHSGRGSMV
jgi:Tol biopolymer transport system component